MKIQLCRKIAVEIPEDPDFTDLEKKLVCGDPKVDAWNEIPSNQAVYFLKTFLQNRGYQHPEVQQKSGEITILAGIPTYITRINVVNAPEDLDIKEYWLQIGRPLTPARLNQTVTWINSKLKHLGYACPLTTIKGDIDSGVITATLQTGEKQNITAVESEPTPGIIQGVLRRYDAFQIGDQFDSEEVELTENRTVDRELVMSTHFDAQCKKDGVKLKQTVLPGEPRILTVGFGFDSEQFVLGRFSWKNTRLGSTGSNFEIRSTASYIQQEIAISSDLYYLPLPSRHYLNAFANIKRENERRFETRSSEVELAPVFERDLGQVYFNIRLGPAYNFIETIRGEGPQVMQVTSLDLSLLMRSHDYEYYQLSPRSGFKVQLDVTSADQSMWSDISGQTYELSVNKLWNFFNYEPPLWVFAIRSDFATTAISSDTKPADLPTQYRYYLGGSADLRGFGRKAIPPNDLGALTKAYVGLDARLTNTLPYKLQPLFFIDVGAIGDSKFHIDQNRFYSPGTGIRWESPVGSFQGTLAQGMVRGPDQQRFEYLSRWQFYLSFGDVF